MRIKYMTMMVADMEESLRFYTEVIGFTVASRHNPRPGVRITLLKGDGDAMIELIENADEPRDIGLYAVGMEVDDMGASLEELRAKGARVTMEPVPIEVGTLAFLEDPNGVRIALIEHR